MQALMTAAVVRAFGQALEMETLPLPVPDPGKGVVKIGACRVCHTDLHAAHGDWPIKPSLPFVPGHEGLGTVSALGGRSRASRNRRPSGRAPCRREIFHSRSSIPY